MDIDEKTIAQILDAVGLESAPDAVAEMAERADLSLKEMEAQIRDGDHPLQESLERAFSNRPGDKLRDDDTKGASTSEKRYFSPGLPEEGLSRKEMVDRLNDAFVRARDVQGNRLIKVN